MFGKLKDMGNLVKKAQEMKSEMKKVQDSLKLEKIMGENSNKTVKVLLNGELECLGIQLSPELAALGSKGEKEKKKLEKEIQEAFNVTAKKAKTIASSKLSAISEGLDIPGLT
ncbi:MAG: hypothetical protein CMP39_03785 [Rickettsiales bacterium]|jgi:DNA-binding protein YbaB|nr:hypothetical protein [Rickettsiales bacterium]|tara:strand:+ start:1771 stop:2109 length:339 start_codon:yes stop_codon:yes gene_type:complete